MKHQKGVVLVVVLILILPITLIAISVMQWSREGSKATASNNVRVKTEQQVIGTLLSVRNVSNLSQSIMSMPADDFTAAQPVTVSNGETVNLYLRSPEGTCKSSSTSNSSFVTTCRVIHAQATKSGYGKSAIAQTSYVMGIEQPLLTP